MPTFDGKSEKIELFEDPFQTSLKIHNQLTEDDKINYFHSLMRWDALQTFQNINGPARDNLGEILVVFRRKYVKQQSRATVVEEWAELTGGGGLRSLCIKIGYSELTRAESRERTSTLAESSRVT